MKTMMNAVRMVRAAGLARVVLIGGALGMGAVHFAYAANAGTATNNSASAPAKALRAGQDYTVVTPAQPTSVPAGKVEVLSFFWFGCGHCADFEKRLSDWAARQGGNVVLRPVPVAFRSQFEPHSRLYHALAALGLANKLVPRVFDEIHQRRQYLMTREAQADFLEKHGVDRQRFLDAYDAFGVVAAVKRDTALVNAYRIDATPSVVIQGKYLTSPAQTNSLDAAIGVIDRLNDEIQAKRM